MLASLLLHIDLISKSTYSLFEPKHFINFTEFSIFFFAIKSFNNLLALKIINIFLKLKLYGKKKKIINKILNKKKDIYKYNNKYL